MINEGKFRPAEATSLVTITIAAKVFFTSSATVATVLGTSGWYMTIISASTAMLGFFLIYRLLKRFPENDLEEIFELSFRKVFGFLCSGVLSLYLLLTAITRLAEFSEVMRVYVLYLSPNWYISGFFIASVLFMSTLGLENVARLARIFAYPMLIAIIFVLLMAIQNFKINNLYPIVGYGLKKTILTGFVRSSVYGEIIVLAIFSKSLQGVKHIKKVGFNSLLLSGLLIAGSVLAFTLT